jgi:hypothetical protein
MSERKWAVDLLIIICIAGGLGIGWYCGKAQGRAEQDNWWLGRVTGRELPAQGSVLRNDALGAVYCVMVTESKHGFTAQQATCGDATTPVVKEVDDGNASQPPAPKQDSIWRDVTLTLQYAWLPEYGATPKPQIKWFCPKGWVFSGAYKYETGEALDGQKLQCVPDSEVFSPVTAAKP